MSVQQPPLNDPNLVKRSLAALKDLRSKYESLDNSRREPIAIVGMGCRYPGGGDSPEALWKLLCGKVDAVTEIPADRWEAQQYFDPEVGTPGKMHMRFGAFLSAPDQFDPYFFGISPREAAQTDPQQRIFLEVTWHALEDAGLSVKALAGSDTGVFVGANTNDYLQMQMADPQVLDTYSIIGGTNCIIPNRLSYLLDLRGPSISYDSACSSSLVAVHQACQSLRSGEISIAIAGGLNLILSPVVSMAHSKGLPLAPDGRCKTFDSRADGYVRGEGCGVVVLKRLSDALAAKDNIWAVIHGSAVNQDGLSNGLTAPNGKAQRAVIRKALQNARLTGAELGLLEAHGTGTSLGDPIEVESLGEIYGPSEGESIPCALGSVKTNIGHLEAGAGIAGLIKVALSLKHAAIPPNLHFQKLNPHISLEGTRLYVPTELTPWPGNAPQRFGSVSSFGAGGTNAHIVLGSLEPQAEAAKPLAAGGQQRSQLLLLSARSATALAKVAQRMAEHLSSGPGSQEPFEQICATAGLRRTHHNHRLSIVTHSRQDALEKLRAFKDGSAKPGVRTGLAARPGRVVFTFPAQGSGLRRLRESLVRDCPAFASAFEKCSAALSAASGGKWAANAPEAELARPGLAAAMLFAVQVALAEQWRSWGVEPSAVMGQGLGEVAAACVSGAIPLENAARIIWRCGEVLGKSAGGTPTEQLLKGLLEDLRGIASKRASVDMYSVEGELLDSEALGPSYWVQNLRRPVPPLRGVEPLVRAEHQIFIELSPQPVLISSIEQACAQLGQTEALALPSARQGEEGLKVLLESVSALHTAGLEMRLEAILPPLQRLVALPSYPFERESFWFKERQAASVTVAQNMAAALEVPVPEVPKRGGDSKGVNTALQLEWAALSEQERASRMHNLVHTEVARILKFDPSRLSTKEGFFQMGMDSVMAAQLRNRLEQSLGRKFAVTVIFENPSVEKLGRNLAAMVAPAAPAKGTAVARLADSIVKSAIPVETGDTKDDIAALLARELEETSSLKDVQ
jgi:acyl transferase domain-containing protein